MFLFLTKPFCFTNHSASLSQDDCLIESDGAVADYRASWPRLYSDEHPTVWGGFTTPSHAKCACQWNYWSFGGPACGLLRSGLQGGRWRYGRVNADYINVKLLTVEY